jgi:hypothetical protein
VFLYGFDKNEVENIEDAQLEVLREIAVGWLSASHDGWDRQVRDSLSGELET